MAQENIIKGSAVHLTNLSTRLKSTTFFVKHTFESGRDLPEARDLWEFSGFSSENLRFFNICRLWNENVHFVKRMTKTSTFECEKYCWKHYFL